MVDFPEPLLPTRARMEPGGASSDKPEKSGDSVRLAYEKWMFSKVRWPWMGWEGIREPETRGLAIDSSKSAFSSSRSENEQFFCFQDFHVTEIFHNVVDFPTVSSYLVVFCK